MVVRLDAILTIRARHSSGSRRTSRLREDTRGRPRSRSLTTAVWRASALAGVVWAVMASAAVAEDCPPPGGEQRWLPPFERWVITTGGNVKFDVDSGAAGTETRAFEMPGSGWAVDELGVLAPEDPEALQAFAGDGCEPKTDSPAWANGLEALAFFRCPRTSWEGAFVEHPDGLVLAVEVIVDDTGAPGCAARRMLESLTPRNPELGPPSSPLAPRGACVGRCVFQQGTIETRSPIRVFEAELRLLSTHTQVLAELKPAGQPHFRITIGTSSTYFPVYRGPEVIRVLGFDLPGGLSREPESPIAWGATALFTPPDWDGSLPRSSYYIILRADDDAAMARGRRFLASMRPGPDWTPGTRLEPFVPSERPVVSPPSPEEPMRWKLALPIGATLVAIVAAFVIALRRRRR